MLKTAFNHKQLLDWEKVRNIEFSAYNTQYGAMSGKKIFKDMKSPKDLYTLPYDTPTTIKHKVADYTKEKVQELQGVMDDFKKIILNK